MGTTGHPFGGEDLTMRIRRFRKGDAVAASQIISRCFLTMDVGGNSPEGVQLQLEHNTPQELIARAETGAFFVAADGGEVIGIGGYGEGMVRTVFVEPDHHRHGIGTRIMKRVLSEARKNREYHLECWSTHVAEPFYAKLGFKRDDIVEFPTVSFVRMTIDLAENA